MKQAICYYKLNNVLIKSILHCKERSEAINRIKAFNPKAKNISVVFVPNKGLQDETKRID